MHTAAFVLPDCGVANTCYVIIHQTLLLINLDNLYIFFSPFPQLGFCAATAYLLSLGRAGKRYCPLPILLHHSQPDKNSRLGLPIYLTSTSSDSPDLKVLVPIKAPISICTLV
jgi:hypothetical protein